MTFPHTRSRNTSDVCVHSYIDSRLKMSRRLHFIFYSCFYTFKVDRITM